MHDTSPNYGEPAGDLLKPVGDHLELAEELLELAEELLEQHGEQCLPLVRLSLRSPRGEGRREEK